jgi:hypothetical protein
LKYTSGAIVAATPRPITVIRRFGCCWWLTAIAASWVISDTPASRKTYRQFHQP